MVQNERVRRDFARTIGDVLLAHLYREAGGDGSRAIRIDPYRAAVFLTGNTRPPRVDVRHADDVLYVLTDATTPAYRVARCPDVHGAYLIQPRTSAPRPA